MQELPKGIIFLPIKDYIICYHFKNVIGSYVLNSFAQTGKLLKESEKETGHKKAITSLSKSIDGSHFITGSLDKSAKVITFSFCLLLLFSPVVFLPFSYSDGFYLLALGCKNLDASEDLCDGTSCECSYNVSTA